MLFKMPRLDWIILTCCRDPHWTGFEMCEDYYARARKAEQLFCSLLRFLFCDLHVVVAIVVCSSLFCRSHVRQIDNVIMVVKGAF